MYDFDEGLQPSTADGAYPNYLVRLPDRLAVLQKAAQEAAQIDERFPEPEPLEEKEIRAKASSESSDAVIKGFQAMSAALETAKSSVSLANFPDW